MYTRKGSPPPGACMRQSVDADTHTHTHTHTHLHQASASRAFLNQFSCAEMSSQVRARRMMMCSLSTESSSRMMCSLLTESSSAEMPFHSSHQQISPLPSVSTPSALQRSIRPLLLQLFCFRSAHACANSRPARNRPFSWRQLAWHQTRAGPLHRACALFHPWHMATIEIAPRNVGGLVLEGSGMLAASRTWAGQQCCEWAQAGVELCNRAPEHRSEETPAATSCPADPRLCACACACARWQGRGFWCPRTTAPPLARRRTR